MVFIMSVKLAPACYTMTIEPVPKIFWGFTRFCKDTFRFCYLSKLYKFTNNHANVIFVNAQSNCWYMFFVLHRFISICWTLFDYFQNYISYFPQGANFQFCAENLLLYVNFLFNWFFIILRFLRFYFFSKIHYTLAHI